MTPSRTTNIALLYLIIILSATAVISNLPSFPKRSVGSFEYVRKAEALLDKGKYGQAVKYFETAHESSPQNDTISSDLAYAYSMYARMLSGEKRFDDSIKYLEKAYNVTANSSTLQNLAGGYSEKALYEAKKGYFDRAKDDYARARKYAAMSARAARNIGIIIYNDGVGEFKSGNDRTAMLCLRESALVYHDPRTLELLGDIYYKNAEFKKARYYWHQALFSSQAAGALSKKIRKVTREMALESRQKEADISHFEIRYMEDLPLDRDLVAKTLEQAYMDIGKDLGYFPDARTKIFFYSKDDFKKTFGMPYFIKAFYDGSIKMPAPETGLDKERLARYVYHEYTHAIVSAKTKNNCPAWLSEGLAVWEEVRKGKADMLKVAESLRNVPEISFRFMDESFRTEDMSRNKALCYVLGYTLIDFILDGWGLPGLRGVLNRLSGKQHIVNAIDDELLMSEKDFENKWREYVKAKFFKKSENNP